MASSQSGINNAAFQEALQRAKQLAAKLTQQPGKRPAEEPDSPDPKRLAAINDPIGAQLAAMKQQTSIPPSSSSSSSSSSSTTTSKVSKNAVYLHGILINGEKTLDMMVPGSKVGYVIGKGGEMIRNLQERAGVKMTVFQETNEATTHEKQLRIIGDPEKVDFAKQLVNDLLTEKEIETIKMKTGSNSMTNDYGTMKPGTVQIPVSPQYIGLVIGKGGETIRKIQQETGAKVQFDTTKSDANGNKICICSGQPDCVQRAVDMVKEIIEMAMTGRKPLRDGEYTRMPVPAYKCGAVIGRGGETIRQIKQQAGCDIELDKEERKGDNPNEKYFIIRGPPEKIAFAQQLILDRINGTAGSSTPTNLQNPTGMSYNELQQWTNYWQSEASQSSDDSKSQDTNAAAWAAYYAQYYAQAQTSQGSNGSSSADTSQQQADPTQAQSNADYTKQWIEYYRACGMHKEAEMIEQMAKQGPENDEKGEKSGESGSNSSSYPSSVSYPGYNYSNYSQN